MAKKDKAQDERPALRKRPEGLMANIARVTSTTEEQEAERRHPSHRRNQVRIEDIDD